MFSSKGKESSFAPANNGQAAAQSKRTGRSGAVPSIVSSDLCVSGSLNTSGDMQIDGVVEGDVRTVGLVIGEKAEVHGEIWAEDLTIRGKVIGRIHARKVLLATGLIDEVPRLKGIEKLYGKSVHHCPYCDGFEHREQPLAVYCGALHRRPGNRHLDCGRTALYLGDRAAPASGAAGGNVPVQYRVRHSGGVRFERAAGRHW